MNACIFTTMPFSSCRCCHDHNAQVRSKRPYAHIKLPIFFDDVLNVPIAMHVLSSTDPHCASAASGASGGINDGRWSQ